LSQEVKPYPIGVAHFRLRKLWETDRRYRINSSVLLSVGSQL